MVDLEKQLKMHIADKEALRVKWQAALVQVETLETERRQFIDNFKTEERQHRQTLEAELKKMNQDLNRLRQARDNMQKQLDLKTAKEALDLKHHQELKALAQARKDRLTCLEQDMVRLKSKCAAQLGEGDLMAFFEQDPLGNPYRVLKEQLTYFIFI